jgi:hypothetical protein
MRVPIHVGVGVFESPEEEQCLLLGWGYPSQHLLELPRRLRVCGRLGFLDLSGVQLPRRSWEDEFVTWHYRCLLELEEKHVGLELNDMLRTLPVQGSLEETYVEVVACLAREGRHV